VSWCSLHFCKQLSVDEMQSINLHGLPMHLCDMCVVGKFISGPTDVIIIE